MSDGPIVVRFRHETRGIRVDRLFVIGGDFASEVLTVAQAQELINELEASGYEKVFPASPRLTGSNDYDWQTMQKVKTAEMPEDFEYGLTDT